MSNENQSYLAILKQYENNTNSYTTNESAKVYDLKNYFTTYLSDKQKTGTKTIRILPTKDGSSPFVEVHGHKIQVEGEWKTFICLKHQKNEDCPFCEAREALLSTGKDQNKELAKKYSARKMYVVKLIDRDNEQDGPKFWRFNHDYRKTGTLDKIYGVLQAVKKDITHQDTGRDLLVMLAKDTNNRTVIQSIQHVDSSPISEDPSLTKEWLSDDRTWEDVYAIKSYEFLEIIVKGGVPAWDKELKKFVDKNAVTSSNDTDTSDDELSMGVPNVKKNVVEAQVAKQPEAEVVAFDDSDDDLPF